MTAIALLLLVAPLPAAPAPLRAATVTDRSSAAFVRQALAGGREALHAAQEALALATAQPVRAVAERLVSDHRQANDRLEALAQRKHWGSDGDTDIALPPVVDGAVPLGGVGSGQGTEYDARFVARQIDMHLRAVALFRQQSRGGDDPDARRLAGELLPTLEAQLAQLQRLRA